MFETLNKALAAARSLDIQRDEFRQRGRTRWEAVLDSILLSLTNDGRTNRYRRWLWKYFVEPFCHLEPPISGKLSRLSALGAPSDQIYFILEDKDSTK